MCSYCSQCLFFGFWSFDFIVDTAVLGCWGIFKRGEVMSELALAYAVLVAMIGLFLSLCWVFASSYLLTERIEKYLSKSKFVAINREGLSGLGLLGIVIRNCSIALMFLIPKFCERRGLIEENELERLPLHLKKKLLAPWIYWWRILFCDFPLFTLCRLVLKRVLRQISLG